MQKLMEIPKDPSIQVSSMVRGFDRPDSVFIPFEEGAIILVKLQEKVKIGMPLIKFNDSVITAPISGEVRQVRAVKTINGFFNALEIRNDFKEAKVIEPVIKKNGANIKKEILDKLLLGHFRVDFTNKKILVLNAIDDEPYVLTENFYLLVNYEGYLEALDKLIKIYDFQEVIVCVKSTNSENINKLMEYLGMYPNIKLNIVPDLYLIGNREILCQYYNYDIAKTYVIKASLFYHIYNLLLRNRLVGDKLITLSGNGLDNPCMVRVKVGTKLKSIVEEVGELKEGKLIMIANGLMSGNIINLDDFVVTKEFNSLLIMLDKEPKKAQKCLNCGECINICPQDLNPLLFQNKKYFKKVKDKCLNCGLCSYICPVYINFQDFRGERND